MPEEIGVYSTATAKRIFQAMLQFEREMDGSKGAFIPYTPTPIYFVNKSSLEIPAYGCVQIVGSEEIDDTTYVQVDRPFDYTNSIFGPFLFNGADPCGPNSIGTSQWGPVFRAIKDSSSYTTGTRMGPIASSFEVSKGSVYSFIGTDYQQDNLVKLIACETPILAVTGAGGIAANSSGTVTSRIPTSGNWTSGGITYTAWNPTGVAIGSNTSVILFPVDAKWVAVELC